MQSPEYPVAVAKARGLITDFGIDDPSLIDVEAIAYAKGVFTRDAELKGAAARLIRNERGGVVRVSSRITDRAQRRFCVAHELGHYLLHKSPRHSLSEPESLLSWYSKSKEEPEANAFAAELLMPRRLFASRCRENDLSRSLLEQLAGEFQTSLTSTAVRYVGYGPNICALVVATEGSVRWFSKNPDFLFRVKSPRSRIDPRSVAADFFRKGTLATDIEEVPADCWLEDERASPNLTIGELTLGLPAYRTTLSILWPLPGSELDELAAELLPE